MTSLLVPPRITDRHKTGIVSRITADDAGWDLLNVEVRRMADGDAWQHQTGDCEAALVLLGGMCSVSSTKGEWPSLGGRPDVFAGMPHALYLPRGTRFTLTALTGLEVAHAWVPADEDHPPRLITPVDCAIEIRGGGGATRQINSIIPPGFDCQRIVAVEVFTPGGNWSSYPPHKHDAHKEDAQGNIIEADLEEVYYYKINPPGGFAIQRVYADDGSIDEVMVCRDDDIVLVPEGYHPVAAAYGYDCYYLNFLAGSAQSLAYSEDPQHAWIKEGWTQRDPRLPMVHPETETA